jgi:transposase-like protein
MYASWGRNILNAMKFLRMILGRCINRPLILVGRGPWYRWDFIPAPEVWFKE